MLEPRGHDNMFGAVLLKPISKADFGVVFTDAGGYLNMCGHGTIGTMSTLVNLNLIKVIEPETKVQLETPAGIVKGTV
jgi:proline racemase